jgi:1-acyl-sn-glycerol-3-phosphate acyltransferase
VIRYIRTLIFYIGVGIINLGLIPGLVIALFIPLLARNRMFTNLSRVTIIWLRIICGLTYEVTGRQNIPDQTSIILCKHQSAWETFTLQLIFPEQTWVLKKILIWIPLFGWGLAMAGAIAIDRKGGTKALKQVIEQGTDRLDKGLWVVIFPEGTRTLPGQTSKYIPGGAMLAARSGYPVVPVAHNAGVYWPRGGWPIKPGVIQLAIGPRIEPEGLKPAEINKRAATWIEDAVKKMD